MAVERRQVQPVSALPQGRAARIQGFSSGPDRPMGAMTPELAFLSLHGVAPGLLLKAARIADHLAVPADQALLGEGFPEDHFYRLLARHLGAPYLDRPMDLLLPEGRGPQAAGAGAFRLARNDRGLDHVLAPQGSALKLLLQQIRPGQGRRARFAICSPRCLAALVRRFDQPALLRGATQGLADWDLRLSAKGGATKPQQGWCLGLAAALLAAFLCWPDAALNGAALGFSALFLGSVMLRLGAAAASGDRRRQADAPVADAALPLYTIVVPLYREARVAAQLIAALDRIDYPRAKLDIKIMVEARDAETIAAIEALCLPARYDVIVAPPGAPQTKPRALNIALQFARGSLLTVFDAEDRPEPDQLRKAAARFAALPAAVACLQARLMIDHFGESWLARMFALEYAGLFAAVTPGLAALHLPVPLGGTSNHFRVAALRRVGGWDAFNVTEDIDLGYRLARFGFRVEALDSTTREEAPLTLKPWLAQRSRWLKGWMVTLLVHSRQPLRLYRELGLVSAGAVIASLYGTVLSCLLGPLFGVILLFRAWQGLLFAPATPLDVFWSTLGLVLLLFGAASAFWPILLGAWRQGLRREILWLVTYPAYLGLVCVAAWLAFIEAIRDPCGWNKTEHGLARQRTSAPPEA